MVFFPVIQIKKQMKQEPKKFGATYMTMNNPYFIALNESIREGIEANGDVLITRDPAQNQDRQNAQIKEMIDEGVTAIFLNPVDWTEVSEALELCKEAGVAVFNVDTNVYKKDMVESIIWSDNYQAGVQCAEDMMKKKEKADILIMKHYNVQSTNERVQGFLDTIEGHDEYKIVDEITTTSEFEVAMEEMDRILDKDLKFDVVLGGNDPTALGALAGLQSNHVTEKILIYGIDGSPDAKEMIKKGYLEGTSSQQPVKMGKKAVETAYKYLRGEPVEKDIMIDVIMITNENLNDFDIDGWL
ncbi:MAG: sugar ABC transporter substrate-binding protein [Clostridiales bacterium]|nr:sugar ABC transporter substrate-binding protein [Clostridiales bacterium]